MINAIKNSMTLVLIIMIILFMTSLTSAKLNARREALSFKRKKTEELYSSVECYCASIVNSYYMFQRVFTGKSDYDEANDLVTANMENAEKKEMEIATLLGLYFPKIEDSFRNVRTWRDYLMDLLLDLRAGYKEDRLLGRFQNMPLLPLEKFKMAEKEIKQNIMKETKRIGKPFWKFQ